MPLYATTSELRNEVWGRRPPKPSVILELIPEPMSPPIEGSESPPPIPRASSSSPTPPTHPHVSETCEENSLRRRRPNNFSYFKRFLVVLGSSLIALSTVCYIDWPFVHSTFLESISYLRSSPEYPSTSRYSEPASRIEFFYEGQSALDYLIKPNTISLVSLQTKFEKVMNDLDISSFEYVLKHADNDTRDLAQRAKHSSLPNKDPLMEQLYVITSTTKEINRSLQRFSSRVRGILDQIVVANRYILRDIEKQGSDAIRNFDGSPNRFAPALLKPGISGLLREANATLSDLDGLQIELNFASGMVTQLKAEYIGQKAQNKPPAHSYLWVNQPEKALTDFDINWELLEDICAELERASIQVKDELSLFHRISNDLHVIHDKLPSDAEETGSL